MNNTKGGNFLTLMSYKDNNTKDTFNYSSNEKQDEERLSSKNKQSDKSRKNKDLALNDLQKQIIFLESQLNNCKYKDQSPNHTSQHIHNK